MKFKTLAEEWLFTVHRNEIQNTTLVKYSYILRIYLIPQFGDREIESITKREIQIYVSLLPTKICRRSGKPISSSLVRFIVAVIKLIFNYAYDYDIIQGLPCARIKIPKMQRKPALKVFTREEQVLIEKAVEEKNDDLDKSIILTLYTGLRIGEVCGLNWDNFDFKQGIIHVRNSYVMYQDIDKSKKKCSFRLKDPKTESGIRDIPMTPYIKDMMLDLKSRSLDPFPFALNCGRIKPRSLENHLKAVLDKCGIKPMGFHALRHTFATRAIEAGIDIKTISALLGHADTNVTLNVYTHAIPEHTKEVMLNFERIQ